MDAVAARAERSKRTVYDQFGDKRRLVLAILATASDSMPATSRRALDEHLPTDAQITTVAQPETALTAFAIDPGTSIVGSADHAAAFALVAQQRLRTPTATDDLATEAASRTWRTASLTSPTPDCWTSTTARPAAGHFSALTVLLAFERQPVPATADPEKVRQIMVDAVHAFMRAYAMRQKRAPRPV
jgi:TetR/AcrR family transcriptional repressor of mexJK operon